ncbi:trypsin-like peptidase domain-containing protein (plasmid) [Paenibacillus rhizovicinus]|uniref:Trypsin-like peptidase domain-containing protein n=1 Tax=Paenibacillus rhizovicinus TaxID=2704463 RepID=A0A6C0PAJ3_9BACL|nr:serine protease [Paenibacillus rhizovicinus]QHW29368.1 trypsin-like peptidase domain-containing protein [Paenibacillus rhizovicinus]QHW35401.1 trypsin-like peptidase domain-containing protein [Paenibacillus rhizovicinus]
MFFNEVFLADATGFIVEFEKQNYIVTNWHVVSGKNADTNELLSPKTGAIPNKIKVLHHSNHIFGEWAEDEVYLYDNQGDRRWIEHPNGQLVDVVAIPFTPNDLIRVFPLDMALVNTDVVMRPAMSVSIIGFPFGLSSTGWPIWKTGHIASDPIVDYDGRKMFLIDATTRGGMSGSPVFLRISSGYTTSAGHHLIGGPLVTKFLGVYSGRIRDDIEIGRVWKPGAMVEVFLYGSK